MFKPLCILLLLGATHSASAHPVSFDDLLRRPARYHHREVELTGVAHVDGIYFALYRDLPAARRADARRAVFITQRIAGPSYDRLDGQRVAVDGVIDAQAHGHLGRFSCELLLQRVHHSQPTQTRLTRRSSERALAGASGALAESTCASARR